MDNSEDDHSIALYMDSLIFQFEKDLELYKLKNQNGSEKATVSKLNSNIEKDRKENKNLTEVETNSAIGTDDEEDLYDTEDEDLDKSTPNDFDTKLENSELRDTIDKLRREIENLKVTYENKVQYLQEENVDNEKRLRTVNENLLLRIKTILKCDDCELNFKDKTTLKDHYLSEHMKSNFKCVACDNKSSSKVDFTGQVNKDHLDENTKFEESVTLDDLNFVDKAEIDGNTVKNNENISDKSDTMKSFPPVKDDFNFNSETNERQDIFACEICKESFHNNNDLDCHMKLHDDDLRCHLCPYTTKIGEDINTHIQFNHEEPPENVKVTNETDTSVNCNESLSVKSKNDFTCDKCKITFNSLFDLILHIKNSHDPRFTVKCEFCHLVFNDNNIMQAHIIDVHYNNVYQQCTICGIVFYMKDIQSHIITTHMNEQKSISFDFWHNGDKRLPMSIKITNTF